MARAVVAGGGERESERERGEGESKFFARTRTKFETKAPLALRFCSSPVAPTILGPPRGPPVGVFVYVCTLADARTRLCDQFTLETLTKIKFQVHRLPAHAEAYELAAARNAPGRGNAANGAEMRSGSGTWMMGSFPPVDFNICLRRIL